MTSQRGWCPALNAAGEDALRFQSPEHSAVSPSRRPASPKDKSGAAANWSVNTAASGTKLVERVRKDRNFSYRLGLSASVTHGTKLLNSLQNVGVNLMTYESADGSSTATGAGDHVVGGQGVDKPVVARNAKQLKTMAQKGQLVGIKHVAVCDCELSVDSLLVLLAHPVFDSVESLALYHCLTATDGVQRMLVELAGGVPPPETEEEAAAEPEIDEETGEPIEKPAKPEFVPKKRKIASLSLQGNAASFGAAAGEEPNQGSLDELTKVLGAPEILPLKNLNLKGCGLNAVGGTSVATALLPNGSVETVDLSDNQIGKNDDGTSVTAVAQLLQENKFLLSVDLGSNDFDGANAKQLLEAIGNSNTRVPTPEPNAEPDPEDYVDELPPEEDAPTVEIGFPKKEPEVDENAAAAAAAEEEFPKADEAAAAEEKAKKKGDDEDDEDEDDEDEEDTKKEEAPAAEEEELTEEELEEKREAEEAAAAEKLEADKARWEEQQEQFIFGPKRVHCEWDDTVARRVIMQEHITETTELKNQEKASRAEAKAATLAREREDRDRRSGWTHVKSLALDGNPLTSVGAKAVANILRKKIPLSEEEFSSAEEGADEFVRKAEEAKEEAKAAMEEGSETAKENAMNEARTKMEEERDAALAAQEAALAAQAEKEAADEEGDAGAQDAEKDAANIPTVDEDKITEIGEAAKAAFIATEEAKINGPVIKRPEVKKDRDGVTTIQRLSLNSCSIGSKGLKEIAAVLVSNNETLKTLLLRRNKFSVKHAEVPPPDATEEDDPPKPMLRLDVPHWVSAGVQTLGEALKVNKYLVVLDLGFNGLYPANLLLLAEGLAANRTIEILNLDGNHLGGTQNAGTMRVKPGWKPVKEGEEEPEAGGAKGKHVVVPAPAETEGSDVFMKLLGAICDVNTSVITTLGLSSCEVGPVMTAEAATLLFQCASLQNLNLDSNALGNQGLEHLETALSESPPALKLRSLNLRNNNLSGEVGGENLGKIVKNSPTLHSLAWSDNHLLGDAAFAAVCKGLPDHPSMHRLEARKIGVTDVTPLALTIHCLTFAGYLDLSDNEVSVESAATFLEEARKAPSLASLSLWGRSNSFEHLIPQAIEMARACPTLVHVDMGQGLASAITSAPLAEGEDPEDEDLLPDGERLELMCLRNRLAIANK